MERGTDLVNRGLADMLKGGVITDVVPPNKLVSPRMWELDEPFHGLFSRAPWVAKVREPSTFSPHSTGIRRIHR